MIKVKFYGSARIDFKIKEIEVTGKTVKEALKNVSKATNISFHEIKKFLVYLNEINIYDLKGYRTPLNDKDEIMLLSPSSGG